VAQGDANYAQSGDPFSEGTTPVGYYNGSLYGSFQTTNRPSPYGAYDMAGNVWEWTDSFYKGISPNGRILRGGSWAINSNYLQSWNRLPDNFPTSGSFDFGFRCVTSEPTSAGSSSEDAVREFSLYQNYPNPFNPSTVIRYGLANKSNVTLTVFNTLGQQVALLQNGGQEAGYHEVKFDGNRLSSGVYFYRVQAGDFVQTKRLLLIR
jgi:Sulfatase-modifying factor enzyme 1/Secretion system C-terminal sorting domain